MIGLFTSRTFCFSKTTVEDNVRAIVETLSLTKEDQDSLHKKG